MLEIIEKCRKAKFSEVKIYLMWSVAKWNKVKWKKQSEVEWGEVKCNIGKRWGEWGMSLYGNGFKE